MFGLYRPTDEKVLAQHRLQHQRVLSRSEQAVATAFRKADDAIRKLPERRSVQR